MKDLTDYVLHTRTSTMMIRKTMIMATIPYEDNKEPESEDCE
jgi:hypothetical protein